MDVWKRVLRRIAALGLRVTRSSRRTGGLKSATTQANEYRRAPGRWAGYPELCGSGANNEGDQRGGEQWILESDEAVPSSTQSRNLPDNACSVQALQQDDIIFFEGDECFVASRQKRGMIASC